MIVDMFAGPRGWSEGLRMLGLADVGIELDRWACATAAAAGHVTIRADVARFPVEHLPALAGLIGSPPCPLFSAAGKGAGRELLDVLAAAIVDALEGRPTIARHTRAMARRLQAAYLSAPLIREAPRAERSALAWAQAREAALTVQPARFIAAARPRWIALEQVPAVLPLWHTYARTLRAQGYHAWAGILNAADYGVPQTRRRAILVASLDRPVAAPDPTHCQGGADTLFGSLAPWVSMADALGWLGEDTPARTLAGHRSPRWLYPDASGRRGRMVDVESIEVGFPRRDDRGDSPDGYRTRDMHPATGPAPVITDKARSMIIRTRNKTRLADGRLELYERPVTEPSPTLTGNTGRGWRLSERQAHGASRGADEPAMTITASADNGNYRWTLDRPATTITGDPRCFHPGGHTANDGRDNTRMKGRSEDAIRLTLAEALTLQSFPPDYPVQGTKTDQFRQVGDAVPPLLAAHVVAAATGRVLDLPAPEALEAAG